jgi:Uma2 family endonuclease
MVSITDKEQRQLWTAEEFLDWLGPGVHADLIDGERFTHSPVNFRHGRLLNFLHHLLGLYVEQKGLGEVHREVIAVRLSSRNVFLPDLSYFTKEQVSRLAPAHAPFAPTWVADALSP